MPTPPISFSPATSNLNRADSGIYGTTINYVGTNGTQMSQTQALLRELAATSRGSATTRTLSPLVADEAVAYEDTNPINRTSSGKGIVIAAIAVGLLAVGVYLFRRMG